MKSFEDIAEELPNGFHDAEIRGIAVDYLSQTATLSMDLLVDLPEHDAPETMFRPGTVRVDGLKLFIIQPPSAEYNFVLHGISLPVEGFSVVVGENPTLDAVLAKLPKETFVYGFFLVNSNSYLYISGTSVEFFWDDNKIA